MDGVTIIGYKGNDQNVIIPDTFDDKEVTEIGPNAFKLCTYVKSIIIPNNDCQELNSVTIPNSMTRICEQAFEYCISLKSVTIPASATTIDFNET